MTMYRSSDETATGSIHREVICSVIDGQLIFEGDIVLSPRQASALQASESGASSARALAIRDTYRWPDATIPYIVHESLLNYQGNVRTKVSNSIAHWESETPIRFVERVDEPDYVEFLQGSGCWSPVGRQGGKQQLSLGSGCGTPEAIHEIGHTVGLWHEQSRIDRDQHVTILWQNIEPGREHNFGKKGGDIFGPYDYRSMMHYGRYAWSVNGQPTIQPAPGYSIGHDGGLSEGDVAAVSVMYPEPAEPPPPSPGPPSAELLFHDERFRVTVEWTSNDATGVGLAVSGTKIETSGLFYFFDPTNWELLVKVIDGTDFNGHFWVFVAGATDVGWVLTVEDTQAERTWTGSNPLGTRSAAITDTLAFAEPDETDEADT